MNLLEMRGPHSFGPWSVTQLVEWEGEAFHHSALFQGISMDEICAASPAGANRRMTDAGMIITTNQLFVLRREGLVILIELGTGNGKTRPAEPYWDHQNLPYLETLASLGIKPGDVDYAFISHAHVDHVGAATQPAGGGWAPTFPRARYILSRNEWAYWSGLPAGDPKRNPCIDDSVLPLVQAGCVQWAEPGESLAGIRLHDAAGHTPGNLLFEVEGSHLWFVGDLLHHPAQVRRPEWLAANYDYDRAMSVEQRKKYFKRFAETGAVLFGEHTGNAFRIKETGPGKFITEY